METPAQLPLAVVVAALRGYSTAARHGIAPLPNADVDALRSRLAARFHQTPGDAGWSTLRGLSDSVILHHPDGWRCIPDHLAGRSAILLIETTEGAAGFRLAAGDDLVPLLAAAFGPRLADGFEFGFDVVVCDEGAEFLIGYTDHARTVAAGAAIPWLEARLPTPLAQEVRRAADAVGVRLVPLAFGEVRARTRDVSRRFSDGTRNWLWESLTGPVTRLRLRSFDNGPAILGELVGERPAWVFFDEWSDQSAFAFSSGSDLVRVFDQTYPMEFYVADADLTSLLCVNDHDVIFASGAMAPALAELIAANAPHPEFVSWSTDAGDQEESMVNEHGASLAALQEESSG